MFYDLTNNHGFESKLECYQLRNGKEMLCRQEHILISTHNEVPIHFVEA